MTLFFVKLGYYFYKQTNLKEKKKKEGGRSFQDSKNEGLPTSMKKVRQEIHTEN